MRPKRPTARALASALTALAACSATVIAMALTPAPALALPEGRHYEMVSPPYKGGSYVQLLYGVAVAGKDEGDSAAFSSLGTFAGEPNNSVLFSEYLARRGATGWSTTPLMPPTGIAPEAGLTELAPTLESALFLAEPAANVGAANYSAQEAEFLERDLDTPDTAPNAPALGPNFELAGFPLSYVKGGRFKLGGSNGASSDLCHLVFYSDGSEGVLLPEAQGTRSELYELASGDTVAGCGGEPPALRLVGVSNTVKPGGEHEVLDPSCPDRLGANDGSDGSALNAVSSDGSEVFFTTDVRPVANDTECDGEFIELSNPSVLYVRLNGEKTVEVSTPIAADCQSGPCTTAKQARAEFVGANEAGTRVYFTTTQPLVSGDTDTGKDLYVANIGCPAANPGCGAGEREVTSLVQASHDLNGGEAAEVQGVSVTSPDGGRAYFVAHGVLSGTNAEGHAPLAGADNLYVYDANEGSEGTVHFVADLCSGPAESGTQPDTRCPGSLAAEGEGQHIRNDDDLWGGLKEAQTTGDGLYLVFTTYAQLVAGDTSTGKQVYRYDAQSGTLDRVSLGEDGYEANGNNDSFDAQLTPLDQGGKHATDDEMIYRAISEDGSRIVFETAEPLSPAATNGLVNAYEWHKEEGWSEGRVSLVSSGSDERPVGAGSDEVVITPSGKDIFFMTVAGLLPQDTDGAVDIYDARLGEGFPAAPEPPERCSGEACQGPLTNPAPLLVPGSVEQAPGENVAPASKPAAKKKAPAKKAKKKVRKKKKKGKASGHAGRVGRSAGRSGR